MLNARMTLPSSRRFARPLFAAAILVSLASLAKGSDRIAIKVIALTGFEVGDDTGDAPGELQFWVEREKLTERIEVPGAPHALLSNAEGLYAEVAGNTRDPQMTPLPASELVMALCLDPQLDLRRTYWIVNGIAGIDPAFGPMGSAVWAENVVDGDAMREIDESEMPAGWPYGLFAIGTDTPGVLPTAGTTAGGLSCGPFGRPVLAARPRLGPRAPVRRRRQPRSLRSAPLRGRRGAAQQPEHGAGVRNSLGPRCDEAALRN